MWSVTGDLPFPPSIKCSLWAALIPLSPWLSRFEPPAKQPGRQLEKGNAVFCHKKQKPSSSVVFPTQTRTIGKERIWFPSTCRVCLAAPGSTQAAGDTLGGAASHKTTKSSFHPEAARGCFWFHCHFARKHQHFSSSDRKRGRETSAPSSQPG